MLVAFRVIGGVAVGVAVGVASVIAPTHIAEIAPPRIRGRLGSLQQFAIVTRIFLALLVDYALETAAGRSEKNLGLGLAYGIYTTFAVLSLLFVLRFIRETKGVELEEMPG